MITASSLEIVPGAGVGAYGVGSDGLMRAPRRRIPVTAPAGSGGERRAAACPHLGCEPAFPSDTRGDRPECPLGGLGREGVFPEGHQVECLRQTH